MASSFDGRLLRCIYLQRHSVLRHLSLSSRHGCERNTTGKIAGETDQQTSNKDTNNTEGRKHESSESSSSETRVRYKQANRKGQQIPVESKTSSGQRFSSEDIASHKKKLSGIEGISTVKSAPVSGRNVSGEGERQPLKSTPRPVEGSPVSKRNVPSDGLKSSETNVPKASGSVSRIIPGDDQMPSSFDASRKSKRESRKKVTWRDYSNRGEQQSGGPFTKRKGQSIHGGSGGTDPPQTITKRDPLPIFLEETVQSILRRITGLNIDKIASPRKVKLSDKPNFKLLTESELEEEKMKGLFLVHKLLQMPPFMLTRKPRTEIYSRDPEIAPILESSFVFTDISYGCTDRDRLIVKRDQDGTLREATNDERDRMNQVYLPKEGRAVYVPKMLEEEQLEVLLKEENPNYLSILDLACVQFEPDNEQFVRVTQRIYEHILERKNFDVLRSTRFFGPMAFYFAYYDRICPLVLDMIQHGLLRDAASLINLNIYIQRKVEELREPSEETVILINKIKTYIKLWAKKEYKGPMELALQAYINASIEQNERAST